MIRTEKLAIMLKLGSTESAVYVCRYTHFNAEGGKTL